MSKKEKNSNKAYKALTKKILKLLQQSPPLSASTIFESLHLSSSTKSLGRLILIDLVKQGVLECKNKQYLPKGKDAKILKGTLRVHPRGFGFFQPEISSQDNEEVFIPKQFMKDGVDGDTVEVEINPHSNWEKGPDGKILSIIKRGRSHLAGTVYTITSKGVIYAHCPLLGASKPVMVKSTKKVKVGDRVILKVTTWADEENPTEGDIVHILGHISDPSIDIEAAIKEFDLNPEFPKSVMEEAEKWGQEVSKKDLEKREDLTALTTITIDPETAKDFDDALSISKDAKGLYHVAVHIADVAHYVSRGSQLDKEAFERCNSTYFPGFCLPMLPHELSSNLCSLQPNVIRLTVSVLMVFNTDGSLASSKIVRSYIKSDKRFTYEEAKQVLDKEKKSPFLPELQLLVELCHLLKKKRSERGSIDFALPDLVILVDKKGDPIGTKVVEYDITHQLVEEYMLKANELVAKYLDEHRKMVLFRIHEEPSKDNMEEFYALARSLGFTVPLKPTQQDIQALFEKAKKTAFAQQLSVSFIRSMKLAYYSADNVGHFGLALEYYCHFTSPIRRYTDLVIQRLLFHEEGPHLELCKIALTCSEKERISFRAETSVKNLKKFRLLEKWMKEEPLKIYRAITTKVKPFGIFFELPDLMLEGFLHVSELEDDYFIFNPKTSTFTGRSTGKVHKVGELLSVRPISLDLILLESKWELISQRKKRRNH